MCVPILVSTHVDVKDGGFQFQFKGGFPLVVQLGQLYRHTVRHLLFPVVEDQKPGLGDGNPLRPVEVGVAGEGGIQIHDVEDPVFPCCQACQREHAS